MLYMCSGWQVAVWWCLWWLCYRRLSSCCRVQTINHWDCVLKSTAVISTTTTSIKLCASQEWPNQSDTENGFWYTYTGHKSLCWPNGERVYLEVTRPTRWNPGPLIPKTLTLLHFTWCSNTEGPNGQKVCLEVRRPKNLWRWNPFSQWYLRH